MTTEIYEKVFDAIKAEKGENEKVTVGDCIAMMMSASDEKTRFEAALTAVAFLEQLPDDPILTPETKLTIRAAIVGAMVATDASATGGTQGAERLYEL